MSKEAIKRELSSIYIRSNWNGTWDSWSLTDCPWLVVEDWLAKSAHEDGFLMRTIKIFYDDLKSIGDQLDIRKEINFSEQKEHERL